MPVNNIVTDKTGITFVTLTSGVYILNTYEEAVSRSPSFNTIDVEDENASGFDINIFASYITQENLIQNNVPTGVRVPYTLYENSNYESGFGTILPTGDRLYFSRDYPTHFYNGTIKNKILGPVEFSQSKLFLQISGPSTIDNAAVFQNSVLCTSSSGVPSAVPLENNTLMGCKDDLLQSIDGAELTEMFNGEIASSLNGKNIECSGIVLSAVRLIPRSRPVGADLSPGIIIYNVSSNNIEFWDGGSWRTL